MRVWTRICVLQCHRQFSHVPENTEIMNGPAKHVEISKEFDLLVKRSLVSALWCYVLRGRCQAWSKMRCLICASGPNLEEKGLAVMWCQHQESPTTALPSVPSPDSVPVNRLDVPCSYFCQWDVVITITIISFLDVASSCPVFPFWPLQFLSAHSKWKGLGAKLFWCCCHLNKRCPP